MRKIHTTYSKESVFYGLNVDVEIPDDGDSSPTPPWPGQLASAGRVLGSKGVGIPTTILPFHMHLASYRNTPNQAAA